MTNLTKTTRSIGKEDVQRNWHLIDVQGKVLGRTVTDISTLLIGKHKPTYAPHVDSGDYVVVINAQGVKVTGRKSDQKTYTRYSGYPSGLRKLSYSALQQKDATKIIKNAVAGMLPKNRLRDTRITRLFVYAGESHPYQSKFKAQS